MRKGKIRSKTEQIFDLHPKGRTTHQSFKKNTYTIINHSLRVQRIWHSKRTVVHSCPLQNIPITKSFKERRWERSTLVHLENLLYFFSPQVVDINTHVQKNNRPVIHQNWKYIPSVAQKEQSTWHTLIKEFIVKSFEERGWKSHALVSTRNRPPIFTPSGGQSSMRSKMNSPALVHQHHS